MIHDLASVLSSALLVLSLVCGQDPDAQLDELLGRHTRTDLGCSVARAADLDGDGLDDIAVGAYGRDGEDARRAGAVVILSSRDGRLLRAHLGVAKDELLGLALTDVGDLDGDGVRDLAVGGMRDLKMVSGRTGDLLWSDDQHNACLGRVGDADGDGRGDLLLQQSSAMQSNGWRHLVDARGLVLEGYELPEGGTLALVGDLDGDGVSELLHKEGPRWRILNLRRSYLVFERDLGLRNWTGSLHVYTRYGEPVAALGLPGGGAPDKKSHTLMGRVAVVSLRTLELVVDVREVPPNDELGGFGEVVLGLPDRDGDGVDELLISAPDGLPGGSLALHSGSTGERLWLREGVLGDMGLGRSLAWIPGQDGALIVVGCARWSYQGGDVEGLHVLSAVDLEERFLVRHREKPAKPR